MFYPSRETLSRQKQKSQSQSSSRSTQSSQGLGAEGGSQLEALSATPEAGGLCVQVRANEDQDLLKSYLLSSFHPLEYNKPVVTSLFSHCHTLTPNINLPPGPDVRSVPLCWRG